uniref:Uncharacterized protein n=1 Tax=Strigamia maritima TaxID=126957 RepID=T1INV3_STRMM
MRIFMGWGSARESLLPPSARSQDDTISRRMVMHVPWPERERRRPYEAARLGNSVMPDKTSPTRFEKSAICYFADRIKISGSLITLQGLRVKISRTVKKPFTRFIRLPDKFALTGTLDELAIIRHAAVFRGNALTFEIKEQVDRD